MHKHLEDKRVCPHCREPLHEQPYLMSRSASENVISENVIAWIVVLALVAMVLANLR
jgi:hypothetical protein